MAAFKSYKVVSALPGTLDADSVYFVRVGNGFDLYVTNNGGTITAFKVNVPSVLSPLAIDAGTGALEIDLTTLPTATISDPAAFLLLLESLIDGAKSKLPISSLPPIIPRENWCWFLEDFLNNSGFQGGLASSVSGTGAATNTGTGEQSAPGVVTHTTGTTATGRSGLLSNAASFRFAGGKVIYETRVRLSNLSDATDTFTVRLGYLDSVSAESTDGVFFRYTHGTNSGNWQGVCRNNNAESVTNFSIAPVTTGWQKLSLTVYADGSRVDFTIGATTQSVTTNIPIASGRETGIGHFILKSLGTAARSMSLDYVFHLMNLTTAR